MSKELREGNGLAERLRLAVIPRAADVQVDERHQRAAGRAVIVRQIDVDGDGAGLFQHELDAFDVRHQLRDLEGVAELGLPAAVGIDAEEPVAALRNAVEEELADGAGGGLVEERGGGQEDRRPLHRRRRIDVAVGERAAHLAREPQGHAGASSMPTERFPPAAEIFRATPCSRGKFVPVSASAC